LFNAIPRRPRKSQKEGQADQAEVNAGLPPRAKENLPRAFRVFWSSWPSFWLFAGLPGTPSN
jgi:hypothetical protein